MGWLALLFLGVTSLEIFVLSQLGSWIGFWPTIALVFGTALLGAFLAKREGLKVWREWQRALSEMRVPEEGITSGLLVLVAAVLLCTPGVLSDLTGIALFLPPLRRVVARVIEQRVRARMGGGGVASVFDVRMVSPRGVYAQRRVVDADGVVLEDRVVHAGPRARVATDGPGVIDGEVMATQTRRLETGE